MGQCVVSLYCRVISNPEQTLLPYCCTLAKVVSSQIYPMLHRWSHIRDSQSIGFADNSWGDLRNDSQFES
jgi:hypothetical protein